MNGLMKIKVPIQQVTASYVVTKDVATGKYVLYSPTGRILYESTDRYDVIKYAFTNLPDNSLIDIVDTRPHRYLKPKYVSGGYDLSQLTFRIKRVGRYVLPYDNPDLSIPVFETKFEFSTESEKITSVPITGTVSLSVGNGLATLSSDTTTFVEGYYVYNIDTLPSALVVVLEVYSWNVTLGNNNCNPMIVLVKDANNRFTLLYNTKLKRVESYRMVNGTSYGNEVTLSVDLTPPFKLILVINFNTALMFYEKDGRLVYVGRLLDLGFDFRDISNWRSFKIGFGGAFDGALSFSIRRFKVCHTNMTGIRDPTPVTDKYGNPLIIDGRVYFTATMACVPASIASGEEIPTSAHALYSIDFSGNLRLEKIIINRRVDKDNKLYGDHASHLIYDPDTGKYVMVFSSWVSDWTGGTTLTPYILLSVFDMDIRDRGVLVIDSKAIANLPSRWDPVLIYDLDLKKWRLICFRDNVLSVYENSVLDYTGWSLVKELSTTHVTEGGKYFKVGKKYLGVGISWQSPYMGVYDYPDITTVTTINVPAVWGSEEPPPHPALIPVPLSNNKTKYVLVTMSRSYPRADLVIMEADQLNDGYEYPILISI